MANWKRENAAIVIASEWLKERDFDFKGMRLCLSLDERAVGTLYSV